MAITGFMESSLATSEIFNGINNVEGGENTVQKAVNLIKTAKQLTNEDVEAAYIQVKQITDSLTRSALKAFDEERVVLLYNSKPALSVTQSVPFMTFNNKQKGQYVTYVFMDRYISINRDNVMVMQSPAILRDLLIGAVIANGIKRDYTKLSTNAYLEKMLMELYCQFVTRILNREYAIKSDKVVYDTIQYWINKFFLLHIFGANDTPSNIDMLASSHFKYIDELKSEEIKRAYQEADPHKISELLELLKEASPRMKNLNLMTFLSGWNKYYYIPSLMAIDNIEYLIFMIITLQSGNNIISIAASDIVKEAKNIKGLRAELLKLI